MGPPANTSVPAEAGFTSAFEPASVQLTGPAWPFEGYWLTAFEAAPQQASVAVPEQTSYSQIAGLHGMTSSQFQICATFDPAKTAASRASISQPGGLHDPTFEGASASFWHDEHDRNGRRGAEAAREIADELLKQLRVDNLRVDNDDQWSVAAQFQQLAFSSTISSRAAQLALQDASANDAAILALGLHGHVRRAAQSKHANHVVQKIIEVMPMTRARFVIDELQGVADEVARHRFGCRLLCRILEHLSPGDAATRDLLEELLAHIDGLISHAYGSYVIRHILEFGVPEHKHRVAIALLANATWYANHRLGSHVVEAALRSCSPSDQGAIVEALLADEDQLVSLAGNQFGRHVVRAMLDMSSPHSQRSTEALQSIAGRLRQSKACKNVLQLLQGAAA